MSSPSIANRDSAAPGGSVIANRPSRTRASVFSNHRWSSVYASGPSTTARASSRVSASPLPSVAVSDSGGAISSLIGSYAIAAAATALDAPANVAVLAVTGPVGTADVVPEVVPDVVELSGIGDAQAAIRVVRRVVEERVDGRRG